MRGKCIEKCGNVNDRWNTGVMVWGIGVSDGSIFDSPVGDGLPASRQVATIPRVLIARRSVVGT